MSTTESQVAHTRTLVSQEPTFYPLGAPVAPNELWPDTDCTYAGIVRDDNGALSHLLLLPGQIEDVAWKDANAWATKQGGELPTRREQALLFANLPEHFDRRLYWSGQTEGRAYAWSQYFFDGYQGCYHKNDELRARAVRRLLIR